MSKKAATRFGKKRAAARLRALRRKAAAWQRRARRAVTLAIVAACVAEMPSRMAHGQMGAMGQSAMAPAGGIVNRAIGRFQDLNANGPGWMYYGINAADRGLGYNGSYMTVGGFIPYAEDDLGGFWAADLRGHLSTYGGFFSNVGVVRKQYIGGTLGGIGVYWDYDGDMNQYLTNGACGTGTFGQFGHAYNQVGISGEWLTDYGNLRSNGYIPVGSTAYTAGAPNYAFYQNFVMCQNGLDAALSGADLEVGAYIPGLSDWAGMISVGGYALGNSRYNWYQGPQAGKDVVPWFGGVYTRLDMTFLNNWDFSLQANNDSFFDWTGFARLTYRMGGSRRRNVPDQMEQPMMRNEHIVRAHQTPEVATNLSNGGTPWRVIHANNAAAAGGNGTAEKPFTTLAEANAAATNPWDIVLVDRGNGTSTGYGTTFTFHSHDQFLVGSGSPFYIDAGSCCGLVNIGSTTTGLLPVLSNPAGDSVDIIGPAGAGATVANLNIVGSSYGIYAAGDLTGPTGRPTTVENVTIAGNGTAAQQTGVYLNAPAGAINFTNTSIANMTDGGFVVHNASGAVVNYQGSITSDTATNGGVASPLVQVEGSSGSTINLAVGGAPGSSTVANQLSDTGGKGIQILGNAADTTINMGNVSLVNNVQTAINVVGDSATTNIVAAAGSGIEKNTTGAAINVDGGSPNFSYTGNITNSGPATSYLASIANTGGGAVTLTAPAGTPFTDTGDGIHISNAAGNVAVLGANLNGNRSQGILIDGNSSGTFVFRDIGITNSPLAGVEILNSPSSTANFTNLSISVAGAATGFLADGAGTVTSAGSNSIVDTSTTDPAASFNNTGSVAMTFATITSGVPNGTNAALLFTGATGGTFDVTSAFTVGGSPGTVAGDVVPGGVTVTVPP